MKRFRSKTGFSLVEVVLAIGVIGFAIVAILGVLPVGLSSSHSSQGETRATQIAQDTFAALSTQARTTVSPTTLNPSAVVNQLSTSGQSTPNPTAFNQNVALTGGTYTWGADSDGNLKSSYTLALPYKVTVTITLDPATSPTPFNNGYAATVAIRIAWQPINQNYRDFTRVITKY
jgi:uncharacterized protein (TIGR02598 family)